jgi:hypothetical protein
MRLGPTLALLAAVLVGGAAIGSSGSKPAAAAATVTSAARTVTVTAPSAGAPSPAPDVLTMTSTCSEYEASTRDRQTAFADRSRSGDRTLASALSLLDRACGTAGAADERIADAIAPLLVAEAAPTPKPDGKYTSSCHYLLGDFTQSAHGFRFVAHATIHNTGNIGIRARFDATWQQAGGAAIHAAEVVRIPRGRTRDVSLMRVVSQDQIDQIQAVDSNDECRSKVAIVGTFGKAR